MDQPSTNERKAVAERNVAYDTVKATPSPVDEQLLNMDQSLGALYQAISDLQNRLGRILTEQPTSNDNSTLTTPPNRGNSSVVYTLNEMNSRVIMLESMVHDLTGRVEL